MLRLQFLRYVLLLLLVITGSAILSCDSGGSGFGLSINGEPPSQMEVQRRAEALDQEAGILAWTTLGCSAVPRILADAETRWEKKFPNAGSMEAFDADDAIGMADTRKAMRMLDELERVIDEIERRCRGR